MKLLFSVLLLFGLFSSCGQDKVGCQDDSDCRSDRQCVQNICINPGEVIGNNRATPKPKGTTNPPFCQSAADCDRDYHICSFRYGGLSCGIGIEGEIDVAFEKTAQGCEASWSWTEYEGGKGSYKCRATASPNVIVNLKYSRNTRAIVLSFNDP